MSRVGKFARGYLVTQEVKVDKEWEEAKDGSVGFMFGLARLRDNFVYFDILFWILLPALKSH